MIYLEKRHDVTQLPHASLIAKNTKETDSNVISKLRKPLN